MIVIVIILVLVVIGIAAPVQMVVNRGKLKKMDSLIEDFETKSFATPEEKEFAKRALKKELIKLKSKILAQPKATEEANDKLNLI